MLDRRLESTDNGSIYIETNRFQIVQRINNVKKHKGTSNIKRVEDGDRKEESAYI